MSKQIRSSYTVKNPHRDPNVSSSRLQEDEIIAWEELELEDAALISEAASTMSEVEIKELARLIEKAKKTLTSADHRVPEFINVTSDLQLEGISIELTVGNFRTASIDENGYVVVSYDNVYF